MSVLLNSTGLSEYSGYHVSSPAELPFSFPYERSSLRPMYGLITRLRMSDAMGCMFLVTLPLKSPSYATMPAPTPISILYSLSSCAIAQSDSAETMMQSRIFLIYGW